MSDQTLDMDIPGFPAKPADGTTVDRAMNDVATWFKGRPNLEAEFGSALRTSIDEVLDGGRTGRYNIHGAEVAKTERTYLGTKVENVCRSTFELSNGLAMDYKIQGHEVDAKFSITSKYGHSIPTEADGHLCLLMHANDEKSTFDIGLVRISPDVLNPGRNKDQKATIRKAARDKIRWLVQGGRLPENFLLHLRPAIRERILLHKRSGQARVNALFRLVQCRLIGRTAVETVACQQDPAKRVRDARLKLRSEGIVILGHQGTHPRIATDLGLPVPMKGEWVSVRLTGDVPGLCRPTTSLGGIALVPGTAQDPPAPLPARY